MYQGNQLKDNLDTFFLYQSNIKYLIDINIIYKLNISCYQETLCLCKNLLLYIYQR